MAKFISLIFLIILPFISFSQFKLSFDKPPSTAQMLPAGINTAASERDFALSPDGKEIYFTVQGPRGVYQTIVYCKQLNNGQWSKPEIASFAGEYVDLEPAFSKDGKKLYFCSNRPIQGTEVKDFDIWMVERNADGWATPVNLGPVINSSSDEFYPSIAANGNMYFTAIYKEGVGREDIYLAKWENNSYSKPVALDTTINSKTFEFNAYISPDEKYILFTSYGRKDDMGGGDLYISKKDANGNWLPAKHIDMLSSNKLDYCPVISPNGKILFYTSEKYSIKSQYTEKRITYSELLKELTGPLNGGGNIYWVDFNVLLKSVGW